MDPLTIILAITTTTATIAAICTRSKWRTRAMDAGELYVLYKRRCNRKQAAIDDLEHMAGIRSEQLARAHVTISSLMNDNATAIAERDVCRAVANRLRKLEARRIADNAARKVRRQRAKGVV